MNDDESLVMSKFLKSLLTKKWAIGDMCYAPYEGDDLYYKARINSIDGQEVTVEYEDYGGGAQALRLFTLINLPCRISHCRTGHSGNSRRIGGSGEYKRRCDTIGE